MKTIRPPAHLSKESKAIWKNILSEYEISDSGGLSILKSALEAYDRCEQARASIAKTGPIFKDRWGQPRPHPLLSTERDSRAAFLSGLKALNLSIEPLRDKAGRPGGI